MKNLVFECSGETKSPGPEDIIDTYDSYMCTSKKVVTGSWYGEVTHVSGDNGYFFGFRSSCGTIDLYSERVYSHQMKIYKSGCFTSSGKDERVNLSYPFENNQVFGVHINSKLKTFTVFYNNSFFSHTYNVSTNTELMYHFIFGGGSLQNAKDKIKVNFGAKAFTYNVPSLAFINETCKLSCKRIQNIPISAFVSFFYQN